MRSPGPAVRNGISEPCSTVTACEIIHVTMDDEDPSRSIESVSTTEEYEFLEDSAEPKLEIIGNGDEEQLKMSMQQILNDEVDNNMISKKLSVEKEVELAITEEMSNKSQVSECLTGSDISVIPEYNQNANNAEGDADMKLSMYTISPSPTEEDLMSISASLDFGEYTVFDGLMYLGCAIVSDPTTDSEIKKVMAILNEQSSAQLMHVSLSLPVNSEGNVILYEQCSCHELTSFSILQIKTHVAGDPNTKSSSCLALVHEASANNMPENTIFQCHVFRCEVPEAVTKIIQCLVSASRKVPKLTTSKSDSSVSDKCGIIMPQQPPKSSNMQTYVFEANLEFKEEDSKGSFTSCPKDRDYFKLRCKLEKSVLVTVKQVSDNKELLIERCFGLLVSPGRNVRNCDMQLIEMASFNKIASGDKTVYTVSGIWDPNEPAFEILNQETPKDTRVYLTIAVDLVIYGIQEPVRFIIETKAKLLPQNERFWYITKKTLHEHFYLRLREVDQNGNGDQCFQVVAVDSVSTIQRKRENLKLSLSNSQSKSSLPSTSSPGDAESDSDNDEPLLSGSGEVSKDVTVTELEGWSDVLAKWRQNLSQRPRNLSALVRRGIPEALRGEVWQLLAGCYDHRDVVEKYKHLIKEDSSSDSTILRDISRTFPGHDLFKEKGGIGQEALFRICKAYSVYDPEVGYCQGLSFLIAALLLHMPEEQAFGVFVNTMYSYQMRDMFRNSFEELHMRFFQLQRLIEDQMPELWSHFEDLGIEVHMFASQWFLTLFTAKFPLVVVFCILDLFLLDSMDVIFQVALALLMQSKKDLLALDFEGVLKHFRVTLPKKYRTEEAARQLMQTAVKVKVKKLKKYQKEYLSQKEQEKVEDPVERLQKENNRLLETNIHLDRENDDLAFELISLKLELRDERITTRDDFDSLSKELAGTNKELSAVRTTLSEVEEVKKRLEIEVAQLKEMCRRELQRAENENVRNSSIISDYKQICNQLSVRLEQEQAAAKKNLGNIKAKIKGCIECSRFVDSVHCSSPVDSGNIKDHDLGKMASETNKEARELELELARTKLALVEAECKNQDLTHQLNSTISEINASRNSWFHKTISTIREAGKKDSQSNRDGKDCT